MIKKQNKVSSHIIKNPYKSKTIPTEEQEQVEVCNTASAFSLLTETKSTHTEECNGLSLTP